jgi:hypothetical protein
MSYFPEKIAFDNIIQNQDNLELNYSDGPTVYPHYQFAIVIYTIFKN